MNNSILDQLLMKAAAPSPSSVGAQKQATVAETADAKKQALGGALNFTADQMYPVMAGAQSGAGDASATQAELDARYMAPMALWEKYGYNDQTNALIGKRAEAQQRLTGDQSIQRDWNQTAADAISGVGLGAFNGLAGIGALATGIVNRDAGNAMSQGIQSINEAVMDSQSPALQGRRRVNQALNFNDQRDSTQQYEQDLAAGESGFWSGARRIARDAGSAIANAAADPATLLDGTAQALGSVVGVGPMSRVAGAINSKGILAARKAGLLNAGEARMLSSAADKGGVAALIGGMEAGGAFQQTANEILGMDFPILLKNSPEFNKLVGEGLSMEEARATLANTAGLKAAAITAPAAIAMGKFVAKFEAAPMSAPTMKAGLANIGTQVLEEAGQGGVSQMASNKALQAADSNKTLSEGVGEQVGTGALFGGLMAGSAQAPGLAAQVAAAAGSRVMSAMPQTKTPEAAPAPVQTPSVPISSLVPLTTDASENVKAASQLSDAQEAMSIAATESIQANPALDEEQKAAQSYGLSLLESTFTFTEDDKAFAANAVGLPDDLKTKLSTVRNLPEAFAATAEHVLQRTGKLDTQPMDQSYFSSVRYLDEMVERVEALAGNADISSVMEAATPDSPEGQYLSSVYQSMANIGASKLLKDQTNLVRTTLGKAPILEQVSLDNVDEVLVRAKHAPHTLAQNVLDDTLAMDDAGQLPTPLTQAQRTRLQSAQALVSALGSGRTTDAVNDVTRQIAFNKVDGDGFKYPSLVEHAASITDAVIRGDLDGARNELNHLRNFAQTMINKVSAINQTAGTSKRQQYSNWIPSRSEWRMSAQGLNVDLKGDKSAAFGERVHTEATLAAATYNNLAEHFSELSTGIEPLTGVPEMAPALKRALTNRQVPAAKPAAPAPATPVPEAAKKAKTSPGAARIAELGSKEVEARIAAIERGAKSADALSANSIYVALVARRAELATAPKTEAVTTKPEETPAPKVAEAEPQQAPAATETVAPTLSKRGQSELNMVNSIAEKLKLPGIKNLVEAPLESDIRGASYDWDAGTMTVDSRLKGNARVSVILHELGHHVVSQALGEQLGLTPNQVGTLDQDGLLAAMDKAAPEVAAEYRSWLQAREGVATRGSKSGAPRVPVSMSAIAQSVYALMTSSKANAIFGKKKRGVERTRNSSLHEWLADNIGKALESDAEMQGVIGKFFKRVALALKKMYEAMAPDSNFLAAKSVQDWLTALATKTAPVFGHDVPVDPEIPAEVVVPAGGPVAIFHGQDALMPGLDYTPNLLISSFEPAPNPTSRLTEMEDPLFQVLEELADPAKVEELAGQKITKEKIAATREYLSDHVRDLVMHTANRISAFLASKSKSGTMGHWIAQAALGQVPADSPDRAKVFQLQPNGKGAIIGVLDHAVDNAGASTATVNFKLLSSAALAAGQWYLTSGNSGHKKLDEGSVASITGLSPDLVTDILRHVVSQGISYLDAVRGIADNITQAWNLRIKDDASIAQAEAVINSMAAELFATMVHGAKEEGALTQKFFDRVDIYVDSVGQVVGVRKNQDRPRSIPKDQKLVTRYVPIKQSMSEDAISTVLPTLLGVPADDVIYFDPQNIEVSDTQQHSPVPLSAAERKAQERQQNTGFTLNLPFLKVFNLFSDKNMVDMLGTPIEDAMNVATRESAEGKNITVLGGVRQVRSVSERISAEAEARGVSPDQVPVYYRFESISTARSMMRGRYNPQSDKGMRQALTSMKSVADLTNPDHMTLWNTAALQMLGERVYAMKPADITPMADQVFAEPEMVAAIDAIAAALQDSESVTGDTLVPLIQAAATKAKDGLTNELIHVLTDRAQYKLATPEQRKAFESRLYVEADGVANGPAGAVAMMSSPESSLELIRVLDRAAKTGFFIGQPGMNMNTFRTSGLPGSGVDTYAAAGEHASGWAGQRLWERAQQLANPAMKPDDHKALQKIDTQHKTVLDVMQTLLGAGNFEVITDPDTGNVSLKITRSVTKNPVTITVYGSGKKGIGAKLAATLMEELSARITAALKAGTPLADQFGGPDNFKLFMAQMDTLTRNVPGYRDGELAYVWNPDYKADKVGGVPRALGNLNVAGRLKDFRLLPKEFENLTANITEFFVSDLNTGIKSSLGSSVLNNSTLMVQASNWQSLAAIHVYNTEIQKLIASKVAADPNWDYVLQGFSKNDLKELRTKLKTVAPMLRTAMQAWDTTTSGRTATEHQAGSTISGRFPVQHVARTPEMAGVKVAPYLVIGMGDAAMVTNLMNDLDFPEGGMQVYDGINLPFMEAREGGVAANRAIADAWLTNNPLKTLATTFEAVANSVDWDDVIAEYARRDPKKAELLETVPYPDEVLARLNEAAARVEALHATIKELGYSMDQMAATGATHSVEGTATGVEGDALQELFTTTFEKHLGIKADPNETDSLIAGWPVNQDGTKVFGYEDIFRLADLATVTAQDREIIRNVLRTHKDRLAGLNVVMASNTSDLSTYLAPAQAARLQAGTTKGYWLEDSKTLIVRDDVSGDTLAHELTHAATFQILRQHFENGLPDTKWGNAVNDSITAVTKLLYDYVDNGGKSRELSHRASQKFAAFKAEIESILRTAEAEPGATLADLWSGSSQAQRAQATAEFIAHVTTDSTLRSVAKSTLVSRIKDSVIRFLKLVVLGLQGKTNKVISNDVLSQLEFHTEVISAAQADMSRRGLSDLIMGVPDPLAQVALDDVNANDVSEAFRRRVGQYLASTPQVFDRIGRIAEAKAATTTASAVMLDAAGAGFLKTPAQRNAFTQVVATMNTLAKISPAAVQAANRLYSDSLDGLDGKLTATQQDFIRGRTGLAVDAYDRSTLVPAFVALGMVDPEFRAKLRTLKSPGKAKVEGNIDERLQTIGNNALQSVQDILTGGNRSNNVDDALAALAEQVARQSAVENGIVARAESMTFGAMGKANDWVVNHLSSKSAALSVKAAKIGQTSNNKMVKVAAGATSVLANVFNEAGAQANAEAMLSVVNKGKSDFLRSLVKDLTGRTDTNANVYDLIKRVGQAVSKARQFYREQLPSVVAKLFSTLPNADQNKAMFKGLARADLASLIQGGDLTAALNMALDDKARAAEISRIETELKSLSPRTEGRIRKKARLLAEYMNTGVVKAGLLRNADAVANLLDDKVSGISAPGVQQQSKQVVDLVDKLITLYAVDGMDKAELKELRDLHKMEPEGVEGVLGVLHKQMLQDKARHTGRARFNAWKGYIPSEGNGTLIVADTRDDKNLRQKGYTKVADYVGTSLFKTTSMAYYFTPIGKAPFNQGIIQNARMTAGGVDQTTGFAMGFPTAGRITQKTTVDRLAKNAHLDSSREALLAVYDENGNVVAFERSIDPDQLERLQPSTNVLAMLGQWMGRQAEEEMAQAVNFDAVAKVHDMWAKGKHRASEFVNVLDTNVIKDNPVLQDALRLMPNDVKAHAQSLFGTGKFMVRKDMLDDVFGYRDASIGDAWTGNTHWSPQTQERVRKLAERYIGPEAMRILVQGEDRIKNLVRDAKTLIVVKSVVVPAANFVANIFQMLARGVPLSAIARGLRDKTLEVDFYVKTQVEQMEIAVKLLSMGNKDVNERQKLEARIQAIEDSWRRLSIWPLLEAGEFGSITDAGISRDEILLSEGKIQAYIEAKTEKLPEGLRRLGKWALITKDTALFQGLQKSMEYGDFLAKAIVYDHSVQKGMSKQDALGVITDEFVNYDRHPGRFRGYAEDLGLAWFYNYKLRIAKIAFSMLRKDPLRVALLAGMGLPNMELPVTENVFTKAIEGTLGHSIGPGMLFSAPGLNPWVAAMQ